MELYDFYTRERHLTVNNFPYRALSYLRTKSVSRNLNRPVHPHPPVYPHLNPLEP